MAEVDQFPRLGAVPRSANEVSFAVWAPAAGAVSVGLEGGDRPLERRGDGLFAAVLPGAAGDDYVYVLDGERRLADPCSRWQPLGVDGPSRVQDPASLRLREAAFEPPALDELVLYEVHVGTFTSEGTFDAAIEHLPDLRDLGVSAIELMPVATFPGERNWGYDGVYAYAPHPVYGGPAGLARLVDAAHGCGLAVVLDVVYNHVGPGIDLRAFAPYFTDRYSTPWGEALDFARRGVREWALQNAEMWVRDYHVDGLRLDATHAVFDDSEPHVLAELAQRVHAIAPRAFVVAEMEAGDVRPIEEWGHDAQWSDEFHHTLHVLTTGERDGYYAAYRASVADLATQLEREPAERLVVCSQNHDQVGNRAFGDRPAPDELRLRAAALLFAPQLPLLFMGEEYGEQRPFRFFTDHRDPAIAQATREGRRREFERFAAFGGAEIPDPQDPRTFEESKLDRNVSNEELRRFYRELIALRPGLAGRLEVEADEPARFLRLRRGDYELCLNFADQAQRGVGPRDARLAVVELRGSGKGEPDAKSRRT
ncbi:MAG TPA: alpha-amylase family glycosyl hydrolase [Gaiellaceae bacterium]|nr:alpha-amylase family glycosyl hydrolase [Gaiellaceae bacterium]